MYQGQFSTEFLGSLSDELSLLLTTEGSSFTSVALNCIYKCNGDGRCIGLEICKIREDLYQCRACCFWMKLGKENSNKNLTNCRYLRKFEKESTNVAVNKPANMSSAFKPAYQRASNAVDNITVCPNGLSTAHTDFENRPWIKIDLQNTFDVAKVLVYNRQDLHGGYLHSLLITVAENADESDCGYYPGPAVNGDRVLVLCPSDTRGNFVTLQIQSGTNNMLQVCEVQVFVNV
ncbi:uncharacterized protein LOC134257681 [Saccostrea cucullata]|uniref:uncharacterized protein LOC134257681 n=1 Tax=Saccostrea cuccullata TaxID=36930 RepID=UPI002ED22C31